MSNASRTVSTFALCVYSRRICLLNALLLSHPLVLFVSGGIWCFLDVFLFFRCCTACINLTTLAEHLKHFVKALASYNSFSFLCPGPFHPYSIRRNKMLAKSKVTSSPSPSLRLSLTPFYSCSSLELTLVYLYSTCELQLHKWIKLFTLVTHFFLLATRCL